MIQVITIHLYVWFIKELILLLFNWFLNKKKLYNFTDRVNHDFIDTIDQSSTSNNDDKEVEPVVENYTIQEGELSDYFFN